MEIHLVKEFFQVTLTTYLKVLDLLIDSLQLDPAELLVQPIHQGHVRNRVHCKSCLELLFFLLLWFSILGQFISVIMLALKQMKARKTGIELDFTEQLFLTPDTPVPVSILTIVPRKKKKGKLSLPLCTAFPFASQYQYLFILLSQTFESALLIRLKIKSCVLSPSTSQL